MNIIGPALQAGSMNAAQVREALRAQGVTDEAEIERRASEAFAESTALNALLPKLVPGGSAVERLLAGEAVQPGIGAAARVLAPTVGEAVSEGASGGGDQLIDRHHRAPHVLGHDRHAARHRRALPDDPQSPDGAVEAGSPREASAVEQLAELRPQRLARRERLARDRRHREMPEMP